MVKFMTIYARDRSHLQEYMDGPHYRTGRGQECRCAIIGAMQIQDSPTQTLFDVIGGASAPARTGRPLLRPDGPGAGIRRASTPCIRPRCDGSRDKLFWFLSGWMGGPDLFVERFGHPRLRARHLPYAIGIEERDQWLRCMAWAMQDMQASTRPCSSA